jgi:hypothetical protein
VVTLVIFRDPPSICARPVDVDEMIISTTSDIRVIWGYGVRQDDAATSGERTFTVGQAADYLNSRGPYAARTGIDLGITRRQVSRMVDRGELPALQRDEHSWRRVPERALRAKRTELLARLGRQDPAA